MTPPPQPEAPNPVADHPISWRKLTFEVILTICLLHSAQWCISEVGVERAVAWLDFVRLLRNWLLCTAPIALVIFFLWFKWRTQEYKLRVLRWGMVAALVLSSLVFFGVPIAYGMYRQTKIRHELDAMFLKHRWIAYDPPKFDPYKGIMPTVEEIKKDLERLHSEDEGGGGFDGLITFSANGTLAEIPRLAKECGFKAVIMGISINRANPIKPEEEMKSAINAREWVDGFCVGHNPPMNLDFATLGRWIAELRHATDKPVTTTAPMVSYLGDHGKPLREIGDWFFPDCPGFWHLGATPKEMFREARQSVINATELPDDRPVLLKMISFPSGGLPGMTEETQAEFFAAVCRDLYLPPGVYVSFYSAYDLPWQSAEDHPRDWSRPQQFVGLFTKDGRPRPAVAVVRKGFPVQSRP